MTDETRLPDELGHELARRAESVHGAPLDLVSVRDRARQIRRRRWAAGAAAVAALAVIAVPTVLFAGGGLDRSDGPEPAPPVPTHAVDPSGGLPTLQDGVIVYQDGPRIPLPPELRDADGFALLGTDRYVVLRSAPDGNREGVLVDDAGGIHNRFPLYGGVTVGPEASSIAWVAPDRTLHLLVAGSDDPRTIDIGQLGPTGVSAITGDCADACTMAVRTERGGDLGGTVMVSSEGTMTDPPAAGSAVVDISPDGTLVAGLDSLAKDGIHVCGGMYDAGAGDYLWRDCEDNTYDFSPDGALVATTFAEGLGPTGVSIRDARSGVSVAELDRVRWMSSFAWADATHLLAVVVAEDDSVSLVRLGVDGTTETVLDGFTMDPDEQRPPIDLPRT